MATTIGDRLRQRVLRWLFQGGSTMMTEDEKRAQGLIVLARRYYDGQQAVAMTARQKAWLDLHPGKTQFVVNISATVVDAVTERLRVTGFDAPGEETAAQVWAWWTKNRMDALQVEVHRAAVRDGEAFVLTAWNNETRRPDFVFHPRFVDAQAGGDGYGMWMEYEHGDPFGAPLRAVKQWGERQADNKARTRQTHYYPDRIEKWIQDGDWREYQDEGDASWPLPWLLPNGAPLGIPVAHFRNPGLRSELADVIPLQDALNKAWLDILAASDSTAFRMLVVLGFVPTLDGNEPAADGSNLLQVAPGQMLATRKRPGEVSVESIEPASLEPLLQVEERIVHRAAQVSDTPLSRFQFTRQIAAEGTLRQLDAPLIAKIELRQTLFGNAWEDVCHQALRQAAAFDGQRLDMNRQLATVWMPAAVRDDKTQIAVAQGKQALGVPEPMLWSELGYDAQQIEDMLATPEVQARLAALQMTLALGQRMDEGQ